MKEGIWVAPHMNNNITKFMCNSSDVTNLFTN